jgi:nitrite reductase/ring-hydroxylating ferredoxin subunit
MTALDEHSGAAEASGQTIRGADSTGPTRRGVLLGAGALGAAGLLAACGDDEPAESGDPGATGGPSNEIRTADIPEGGGTVFKEQNLVVTQPEAGTFKAFSATCTHMQCQVVDVTDRKINCACHLSAFDIADGSVTTGPATRPLPAKTVTVSGDTLTVT